MKRPLRVLFLVDSRAKWSTQSLYDVLENDLMFAPQILVVAGFKKDGSIDAEALEQNYRFFQEQSMNVVYGVDVDKKKTLSPKIFSPDIVFFQQNIASAVTRGMGYWDYTPLFISEYALTCYIPYGWIAASDRQRQYNRIFHLTLWRYFCETPIHLDMAKKYMENKGENVVVSGYPKMDFFLLPQTEKKDVPVVVDSQQKKRIIWAPHWSINPGNELDFSTFGMYVDNFYHYCKDHPEIDIILKPHPTLWRYVIKNSIFSEEQLETWLSRWKALPNASVMEDGNYFELFLHSDAMILDSISFISEYMYTEKPMLFLCKRRDILSTCFNEYGQTSVKQLYEAHSWKDVEHFIDDVVTRGNDPLREQRVQFVNDVLKWTNKPACETIFEYLKEQLS